MEFTAENVEKVVHQFYHDVAVQAQAHQWLTAAQVSIEAWTFAWEILDPRKAAEVQFYAASTLHVKIVKFWHELPADQYLALREKLLTCIANYATGQRIVLTRLCITLSAYVIHTVPEHWANAFSDIIRTFQPRNLPNIPPDRVLCVLLEVLTIIPEEFQTVHLAHSQRGVVRSELQRGLHHVLVLLNQVFCQQCSPETSLQAVRCISSWFQFGISLPETEPLVLHLLQSVSDENLAESSLEALTNVITHPDSHKYPNSMMKLLGQLLQLEEFLHKKLEEGALDLASSVYSLFIAIAESHSRLLLDYVLVEGEARANVMKLIEIILQCSSTAGYYSVDETCSELAFGFWYILQDDIIAADVGKYEIYIQLFSPVYRALVNIFLIKSMYPVNESSWLADDKESFRCYRQDIADTLMYCYNILREGMLDMLFKHLESVIEKTHQDNSNWQPLESCLHAYYAIAESVDPEENYYLPKFMSALPSIPYHSNLQVIATTLDTIGAYAEWINMHPAVLTYVMPLLVMGLGSGDVAPSATMALKDLTRDCQPSMKPFAEQILTASQNSLSGGILKSNECVRLMYTVGKVLSVLPMETIMNYLNTLLMPYIQELQTLMSQEASITVKTRLLLCLKMIAMLCATLDTKPQDDEVDVSEGSESGIQDHQQTQQQLQLTHSDPQPVLLILQQIMPVIQTIGQKWSSDPHVMEAVCSLLKQAVSTLLDDCKPLVPAILTLIVKCYQLCPHPSALDLAKQFLTMFGREESHVVMLKSLLFEICTVTLALCNTNLSEHMDILEAFFLMLANLLKKSPQLMADENLNVSALFQCATIAISLPEAPIVKAATLFLVNFITQSRDLPLLLAVVNTNGEALLGQTLRCIDGESPRTVMEHMADILLALNKKYFDNLCRWMNGYLAQDNFPSSKVSKEQKENFTRMVLKERANKRKLQETVREFTLLCRGLIGTEYAAQISPFF